MIAYFDCFSGISGDMILGALVDLGVSLEELEEELRKLNIGGYKLKGTKTKRGEIGGTKVDVELDKGNNFHGRDLNEIIDIIKKSSLKEEIKEKGIKIFTKLAEAEAYIHKEPISHIHFHEVGAIDAIVDIMGTLIGLDILKIEKVFSSKIPLNKFGTVNCSHGTLPLPAPAVLEILKFCPVTFLDIDKELTTPTGAAIISTITTSFKNLPDMVIKKIGYGAGTFSRKELPNMLRIFIGEEDTKFDKDIIFVIETNIDDMNPQFYEDIMEKLFLNGALDVYFLPIHMKKNRIGTLISVLTPKEELDKLINIILTHTTTIGLRYYEAKRYKLEREIKEIETQFGTIPIKISKDGKKVLNVTPEYDICRKKAEEYNLPIKQIYNEAIYKSYNYLKE